MFDMKTLQLCYNYPKNINTIDLDVICKINAVVNTYRGRTFVFYNV